MRRSIPLALLAGALLLAGCTAEQLKRSAEPQDDHTVGHIHGLGVDPADDTLYVATHVGLFRVAEGAGPVRVADRWQDTMAFTITGPGHFLASGHPDLREDLPPYLGLIESTDAGETWRPLALQGEADFHILEQAGDTLYAYDATSGRLLATRDRTSFDEITRRPLTSVAAFPGEPETLFGTTNRGELVRIDPATGSVTGMRAPTLVLLDTTADGGIVGLDPSGVVQISGDAGETWESAGQIGGPPAALAITERDWYAATTDHVFRSLDEGATWTRAL